MPQRQRTRTNGSPASIVKAALAVAAWLVIWQLIALVIGNPWLLSGPVETLAAWGNLALTADFWQAVLCSLARIAAGYCIAFVASCVLGYLAAMYAGLRTFLKPAVLAVKSAPVVCIIALLLVAVGSQVTTVIVVALVVFPQFYHAVMEATLARDSEVDAALDVFGIPRTRRVLAVELVSFGSAIRAATRTAAGLAWKSGVAAELIGLPGISIGEGVYLAKISLDSASIIAWTATVILFSWLFEKLLVALVDAGTNAPKRWLAARVRGTLDTPDAQAVQPDMLAPCGLHIEELERDYGVDGPHLRYEDLHIAPGERVCVMAPSGAGKTTLVRMLAGIDAASTGSISRDATLPATSVVLQDCSLVPWATAPENIALVADDTTEIRHGLHMLRSLLDADDLARPARALSGGMRRRAELARALAHHSSLVILDEPFAGLDAATKERCLRLLNAELAGRTLVIATHDEEDAIALDARVVRL